jgi:GTPase SAR1 family protein
MESQKKFNLILLGDGAVGKTSLIKAYNEGVFSEEHMVTLGIDYINKRYTPKDSTNECQVIIWDTAG